MFTVNGAERVELTGVTIRFQNISCLRLILEDNPDEVDKTEFQNISCLRLIITEIYINGDIERFQNISCLRLILLLLFFLQLP